MMLSVLRPYSLRWLMNVEQLMEWELVGGEVLWENLPHWHFFHHKSHMTWPEIEPGLPQGEASNYLPELWHIP
jgi:hypothetical protein